MALDEQLRQLADAVPTPSPGDASAVMRRGVRRRRTRQTIGVTAGVAVFAVLGFGAASILRGPTLPPIADQPPSTTDQPDDEQSPWSDDWPVITEPPSLPVSGAIPFEWSVGLSAGPDDTWCVTSVRGSMDLDDALGERCDQLIPPQQVGDPDRFGTGGSEVEAGPGGTPAQGLSWGFAPVGTEEIVVLFTDGSREQGVVASGGSVPAPLWVIGYEDAEVQAVEARRRDGEAIAGRILATTGSDQGSAASPQAVFADALRREGIDAFTDEQQRLLDLRPGDELFSLPIEGTDRAVGIRARNDVSPLLFATACDVLAQVDRPERWVGLCLEYTDGEQDRVTGLFPYGTTSG